MALQNQEIAERIKRLRAEKGNPPQPLVAEAVGVAERTYQTWEGGEAKPGYRNLERLATYFGVSENFILTGIEPTATPNPFELSDQVGGVRDEFREDVDQLHARMGRIEERLNEAHDERLAAIQLIEEQNGLLARQSQILARIEGLVQVLQDAEIIEQAAAADVPVLPPLPAPERAARESGRSPRTSGREDRRHQGQRRKTA